MHCIHLPLHLSELSYPIPAHAPPYHNIISSSMLDCSCGSPVRKWCSLLLPSIHPSIWSNPVDFCFIWPQNPFPVFHCPVFMLLSKLKMVLLMSLFEQWLFLLDNRAKVPFLECISHCLGSDGKGKNVIDKMSSLNSIIKLSSSDLTDNWLCITRGKLGRMTTFAIFLV